MLGKRDQSEREATEQLESDGKRQKITAEDGHGENKLKVEG